jgi:AcrR family transcriptional regulator
MVEQSTPADDRPRFGPRSAASRQAILDAAKTRFAADGYDRTTIRAIAADADIDPSMVIRYFGNKAALFKAAAALRLEQFMPHDVTLAELPDALTAAFVSVWEQGDNHAELQLLRSAVTHPEVARSAQEMLERQIFPAVLAVLGDTPDARTRAGLVSAQVLGIAYTRYMVGLEPMRSMPVDVLVGSLRATVEVILTRPLR